MVSYHHHPLSFPMSFDSLRKVNISLCKSPHFARIFLCFFSHKTTIDFSLDFGTQFPSLSRSPISNQKSNSFCRSPYSDKKSSFLAESHFFLGARTSGEQCVVKASPPSSTCSSSLSPRRSLLKTSPSPRQLSKPELTNISSTFLGYRVLTLTYGVSQKK